MTWPISNRANNLQVDYHYLRRQVGKLLRYGYNHAEWDDEQNEAVDEIIDEGLRSYYYPPPLPPPYAVAASEAHEWSFMRPIWQFTTEAAQRRYPLPSDWERPIGRLTYPDTDNDFYAPIKFTSSSRLRSLEYQTNFTSYPQFAAIEPGESQGDAPQELVLVLHPTPDSAYRLQCQYQAQARRIDEDHPFPLGGQIHSQGILASVLAVAEFRSTGNQGPQYQRFLERLASNIVRDQQRGARVLGYNHNGYSTVKSRGRLRDFDGLYYNDPTYEGQSYPGGQG